MLIEKSIPISYRDQFRNYAEKLIYDGFIISMYKDFNFSKISIEVRMDYVASKFMVTSDDFASDVWYEEALYRLKESVKGISDKLNRMSIDENVFE